MTPTPNSFSEVLPYKWEAYCSTNGRCTVGFSFLSRLRSQEGPAIQMGGVLPYKLEVYCHTFFETSRGWGFRNSLRNAGVGLVVA